MVYVGVFFDEFRKNLDAEFSRLGKKAAWYSVEEALKNEEEIDQMLLPFLGGDDPLFGTRTSLDLGDFYNGKKGRVNY